MFYYPRVSLSLCFIILVFHLNCVFFHLAEQTVVAGPKAGSLVDLEEDAGVPVEGNKEVVHLEKQDKKQQQQR